MHTIRLRGPWQLEAVARYEPRPDGTYSISIHELPAGSTATMPSDWSDVFGRDFWGWVTHRRIFQRPTGLDNGERVWLAVDPPRSHCIVELNDRQLGQVMWGHAAGRFDVTEMLQDHNHLLIMVAHPALDEHGVANEHGAEEPGGLVGLVRLEIEDS